MTTKTGAEAVTLEELAAALLVLAERVRVLEGMLGPHADRPVWRPRCGAPQANGRPCQWPAEWDKAKQAPIHGRCQKHEPPEHREARERRARELIAKFKAEDAARRGR